MNVLDRLEAEVQWRTADLRELAIHIHLQDVREDERARLARELHDELGGLLTAAKLVTTRIRGLPDLPDKARERLTKVMGRLDEVLTLKRRIIEVLHPSALRYLGLDKSIGLLCHDVAERLSVPVQHELAPALDEQRLAPEAELTVYRLVQESLTNVQRYARAKSVNVSLGHTSAGLQVQVQVQDDGIGFDLTATRVSRHGLAGMRHSVQALGGTMGLHSAPGAGKRIARMLPELPALSALPGACCGSCPRAGAGYGAAAGAEGVAGAGAGPGRRLTLINSSSARSGGFRPPSHLRRCAPRWWRGPVRHCLVRHRSAPLARRLYRH